jgi:hypothetical protein
MKSDERVRIESLEAKLAYTKTALEAIKAAQADVIRAAEDAAYETAAMKLEEYAEAKLSGVAYSTTAVCAMIVRLLKSIS